MSLALAACTSGTTGPTGPQGEAGPRGEPGPAGAVGPAGPAGEAGAEGMAGAMGATGATGAMGPTGPQGPPGVAWERTVVVSPGASAVSGGAALLAALASLPDAGVGEPWLLRLEPGTYDVGATAVTLRPGVHLEGAGPGVTRVIGVGGSALNSGVVVASSDASLRALTVEVRPGTESRGVYAQSVTGFRLERVAIEASSTYQCRAAQFAASSAVLREVTASCAGGTANTALWLQSSTLHVYDSSFSATGGAAYNQGIEDDYSTATVFERVTATAAGGSTWSAGYFLGRGNSTVRGCTFTATGANSFGVRSGTGNGANNVLVVEASALSGGSAAILTVAGFGFLRLANNRLVGAITDNGNWSHAVCP